LAARRLSSLLESLNIQVDDRTGWRLSTASLAGWFDGLLEQVQESGEVAQVRHPRDGHLIALAELPLRPGAGYTLSQWAAFWLQCFKALDVLVDLENDEAGGLIVQSLRNLVALTVTPLLDAAAFRQACRFRMENTRFKPKDVKSPVVFMPMQSTRLRAFKRVLVLGCAQSHFQESPPGLLPPSVAFDLGLPGPQLGRIQKISALWELIQFCDEVVVCHAQSTLAGPEVLLPELQYLDLLIQQAQAGSPKGVGWHKSWPARCVSVQPGLTEPLQINASEAATPIPARLSVGALTDYKACPLRFGLSRCLPFQDTRESAGSEFYALRGTFVHRVFELATRQMLQGRDETDYDQWKMPLSEALGEAFLELDSDQQATMYSFRVFFESIVPRIAGVLATRAGQGWQSLEPEQTVEGVLQLRSGRAVQVVGRLDRLEQNNGQMAITDIKFKDRTSLSLQAKDPLGHPQLPAYQAMLGLHQARLGYL
ncbi:MAG: PD-(D/E)XK nuclease family protein, partial [Limnobacter sp.]|nr:PD-(D/E)XK nuclease family protein [Limnobacter sp.]